MTSSRYSKSSNSSSSFKSMSKDNYYGLIFLALISILVGVFYYTYKNIPPLLVVNTDSLIHL